MQTRMMFVLCIASCLWGGSVASAQSSQDGSGPVELELKTAPVMIDDMYLFSVRGVASLPAEERARLIAERIVKVAEDPAIETASITAVESPVWTAITAGPVSIMGVTDADGALERARRQVLAQAHILKIQGGVERYRQDRTPEAIGRSVTYSILATTAFLCALILLVILNRRLHASIEKRYRARVGAVKIKSFEVFRAQQIWRLLSGLLGTVWVVIVLVLCNAYVHFVLGLFPWTRLMRAKLLGYVLQPLKSIASATIDYLPHFILLVILILVTRWILRLVRLFFDSVAKGTVTISGFHPEWAVPTHNLVRALVLVFAVVVGYPLIPGSGTPAFKAVSLFAGLVFSLGSTSFISNLLSGYMIIYRGLFKVGDRVRIGDVTGDVSRIALSVVHIRTTKNENVTIPSSVIVSSNVLNYSSLAREQGLILHTKVTIGYDTPWRQVDAMLLIAAQRTQGVLREPKPFVLHQSLDDFYVRYELNAYTDNAQAMIETYSDLHRNILDAFNEHGVQIMSPNYRSDADSLKVVPRERWYAAPATPEDHSRA